RSAGAAARWCPRTRPPAAARLAPSAAARFGVLQPERYARSPGILAQGDDSVCSQSLLLPASLRLLLYQCSLDRCALPEGPWYRPPSPAGHDRHLATALSLRATRWSPRDAARERKRLARATVPTSGGRHNRGCGRTGGRAQAPKLVTVIRFRGLLQVRRAARTMRFAGVLRH